MLRYMLVIGIAAGLACLCCPREVDSRGFGKAGGGFKTSGGAVGGYKGGAVTSHYGGAGYKTGSVIGPGGGYGAASKGYQSHVVPGGGSYTSGYKGGSYSGPGGSSAIGGQKGGVYTGPQGGKYVYGTKAGAATGPGGNTVGGVSKKGVAIGPDGGVAVKGAKVGGATGPGGGVIGGSKVGGISGPGGTIVGSKGYAGKMYLPSDAGLAKYSKTVVGKSAYGTHYYSAKTINTHAGYVRTGFHHYNYFNAGWYAARPVAWRPAVWAVPVGVWGYCTWPTVSVWCGYSAPPVYYDYGTNVIYQNNVVYVNGESAGAPIEYAEQAAVIADQGKQAAPPKEDSWQPLGVFGMVQGEEKDANTIFQLAVNKQGVIRGNYYDALTDTTLPVYGAVDPKTQRAAWTIGDKKTPVFEAGIANLTQSETTMLVHLSKDQTQQWLLVRMEDAKGGK